MPSFGGTINVGGQARERVEQVQSYNAYDMARAVQDERQREAARHAQLRLATKKSRSRSSLRLVLTFTWPCLQLVRPERRG